VSAPTAAPTGFSLDEFLAAANRLRLHDFPTVLGIRSPHDALDARDAALDRGAGRLTSRGLLVDGGLADDVVVAMNVLERPDRELAMRVVTPDGLARVCVARRGAVGVVVRRIGDDIAVTALDRPDELSAAVDALTAELPAAPAAQFDPVSAPLDALADALTGTHDGAALSDRIRALGTDSRTAMVLGNALETRLAFAEIVYHALVPDEDRVVRSPAAVAVFYTRRGRIVSVPNASPSGQLWATVKPGSDHSLGRAIGQLVDISVERWGDS
jgi:hypothetical protein